MAASNVAHRTAERRDTVLVAVGEKFDVFAGDRQAAAERPQTLPDNEVADTASPFRPLDDDILSKTIPAFFIGRNKDGFWVARDAKGRVGGLFLRKASAVSFARAQSRPAACATIFLADRVELDLENSGNPLVPYLRSLLHLATQPGAAGAHLAMIRRFCLIVLGLSLALCAVGGVIALKTVAYLSHFNH